MAEDTGTPEGTEASELSLVEQQALEHGWQTEENFKADPKNEGKKWRPAEDFMDRQSLFDKIESQNKQIRDLKKGVDSLTKHNLTIEQATYERARKELQAERKKALDDGDLVKAEELRDRIDEVKEKQLEAKQTPQSTGEVEHPSFTQFKQANSWYNKDVKLTAWADGFGALLARQGKSADEVLAEVHKVAREEFPEKFTNRNPNKDGAPSVGAGRQTRAAADGFKLTEDERRVMQNMIRAGVKLTESEYTAQLKKAKGFA
jgi:hypothetical protein